MIGTLRNESHSYLHDRDAHSNEVIRPMLCKDGWTALPLKPTDDSE